jgi:hypothetical protein
MRILAPALLISAIATVSALAVFLALALAA